VNTNHTIWLSYREKIGIDFLLSGQTEKIIEIRFNVGFPGSLQSDISIGSALDSVLDVYGGAQKTVKTNRDGLENFIFGGNKVMYEQVDENGVITTYKFIHDEMGIIFWFGVDKNVTQIVVYTPYSGKPDIAAEWLGIMQTGDMEERIIGWYGEPEEKVVTDNMIWMVYHDVAGVDFLIDNDTKEVIEVRFNRGFDWATINQISIGSTLIDILNSSGGAKKTVRASYLAHENLIYGVDRVLYEQIDAENITTSYMFINAPEGILFWLDVNETVTQIVIFQPHSKVNIKEGIGLDYVQIRDGLDKIIDLYGEPEIRMEENDTIWLAYREKANIDFLFEDANQTLIEIRFNEGFEGALTNGIRVGSSKEEVLNLSGGANKTVQISANDTLNLSHGSNKVLYEIVDGGNNTVAYKYIDAIRGILYWFDIDGISTQIVVFDPY